jgi:hypothetical protein
MVLWKLFMSTSKTMERTKLSCSVGLIRDLPGILSLRLSCGDDFDYYAFSDQDDEWVENKLSHALNYLAHNPQTPSVYCGRTILTDEEGGYWPLSAV